MKIIIVATPFRRYDFMVTELAKQLSDFDILRISSPEQLCVEALA